MEGVSCANSLFALDLYRALSSSSAEGNIFSPLSISAALSMVYLGARGDTAAEMERVLSFSSVSDVHSHFETLISSINSPSASYILRLANRLYGEKTLSFLPNESHPVRMMYQQNKFHFRCQSEYKLQVLELPYIQQELSMLILLPDETKDGSDPLLKLESKLTLEKLLDWTNRDKMDTKVEIVVRLPKLKLEIESSLSETLEKMGMSSVFQETKADLAGMSSKDGLFISAVIHKAFVEVNEDGTEAAAATCVYLITGFVPPPVPQYYFIADHPFMFFIRHNPTNSILFLGRYTSPV